MEIDVPVEHTFADVGIQELSLDGCRYEVDLSPIGLLGKGFQGEVRAAREVTSGLVVAAKLMKFDFRARTEAKALSTCAHPSVAKLVGLWEAADNEHCVLLTELCGQGELFDTIVEYENGLPAEMTRDFFSKIAGALAYMHENRVAHRDLKAENVLLDAEGNPKLIDMGLAFMEMEMGANGGVGGTDLHTARAGLATTKVGSMMYAAPEVVSPMLAGAQYDPYAADVWSLGVLLYCMLQGLFPFRIAIPELCPAYALYIDRGTLPWRAPYPEEAVESALKRMLAVSAADRVTARMALTEAWLNAGAGSVPPAMPAAGVESAPAPSPASPRKRKLNETAAAEAGGTVRAGLGAEAEDEDAAEQEAVADTWGSLRLVVTAPNAHEYEQLAGAGGCDSPEGSPVSKRMRSSVHNDSLQSPLSRRRLSGATGATDRDRGGGDRGAPASASGWHLPGARGFVAGNQEQLPPVPLVPAAFSVSCDSAVAVGDSSTFGNFPPAPGSTAAAATAAIYAQANATLPAKQESSANLLAQVQHAHAVERASAAGPSGVAVASAAHTGGLTAGSLVGAGSGEAPAPAEGDASTSHALGAPAAGDSPGTDDALFGAHRGNEHEHEDGDDGDAAQPTGRGAGAAGGAGGAGRTGAGGGEGGGLASGLRSAAHADESEGATQPAGQQAAGDGRGAVGQPSNFASDGPGGAAGAGSAGGAGAGGGDRGGGGGGEGSADGLKATDSGDGIGDGNGGGSGGGSGGSGGGAGGGGGGNRNSKSPGTTVVRRSAAEERRLLVNRICKWVLTHCDKDRDSIVLTDASGAHLDSDGNVSAGGAANGADGAGSGQSTYAPNRILAVTDAWCNLCGYTEGEAVGQSPRLTQGEGTDPACITGMREAISAGRACKVSVINYRKGGHPFLNNLTLCPIRVKGQVVIYTGILKDYSMQLHRMVTLRPQQYFKATPHYGASRGLIARPPSMPMLIDVDDENQIGTESGVDEVWRRCVVELHVKRLSLALVEREAEYLSLWLQDACATLKLPYVESVCEAGGREVICVTVQHGGLVCRGLVLPVSEPGHHRIVFERLRGDPLAYHKLFKQIAQHMSAC